MSFPIYSITINKSRSMFLKVMKDFSVLVGWMTRCNYLTCQIRVLEEEPRGVGEIQEFRTT